MIIVEGIIIWDLNVFVAKALSNLQEDSREVGRAKEAACTRLDFSNALIQENDKRLGDKDLPLLTKGPLSAAGLE